MYEKDGICYAGELEEGITITAAKPTGFGVLVITFSTGEQRLLDTTELKGEAFEPLADQDICDNPRISYGTITWKNGEIDLAPEAAYKFSYPYPPPACGK